MDIVKFLESILPHEVMTYVLIALFAGQAVVYITRQLPAFKKTEVDTTAVMLKTYQDALNGLQDDITRMQKRVDDSDVARIQVAEQLKITQHEFSAANQAHIKVEMRLSEDLAVARRELELARDTMTRQQAEVQDQGTQIVRLQTQLTDTNRMLDSANAQISSMRVQIAALEAERNMWRKRAMELMGQDTPISMNGDGDEVKA